MGRDLQADNGGGSSVFVLRDIQLVRDEILESQAGHSFGGSADMIVAAYLKRPAFGECEFDTMCNLDLPGNKGDSEESSCDSLGSPSTAGAIAADDTPDRSGDCIISDVLFEGIEDVAPPSGGRTEHVAPGSRERIIQDYRRGVLYIAMPDKCCPYHTQYVFKPVESASFRFQSSC